MEKIKSEYAKKKLPIRLNNGLFRQFLPKISQNKFKGKKNLSLVKPASDGNIFTHKSQKVFNIPKRFTKNNTKVEDNKISSNTTSVSFYPRNSKTVSNSFYQKDQLTELQTAKQSKLKVEMLQNQQKHLNYLTPKTLQGIERYFEQKYEKKLQEISRTLQSSMSCHEDQTDRQVSEIFSKNKHLYMLSRFSLLELKSYYSSILNFADGDEKKFKYAIQIMLNLAGVTIRESILNQSLSDLEMNGITFGGFLKLFSGIQQKLRKQTIIDYVQILLEEMQKSQFTYEELLRTFKGRMKKKENAIQLSDLLFQKIGKEDDQKITRKEIYSLCYNDEQFCNKFCALNDENMTKQKLKNQDELRNLKTLTNE